MPRRVAVIAALVALAACSREASKPDSSAIAQSGAANKPALAASYDPSTRTVTAVANEYAFLAPDTIPAGWTTFKMINAGAGYHQMQILRLLDGKTAADLVTATNTPGPLPKWAVAAGGPNVPDPKGQSNATVNLVPGQYLLLCFVDAPGHVIHVARGMVRPITVAASAGAGAEPTADISVALTDFAFTVKSGALAAGKHTVKVVNNGPQDHEIQIIRLAPGKTLKDFGEWIAKLEGPAPATGLGGLAAIAKGATGYFNVELGSGNYVFVCFATDAKDNKPHIEHGMVKEFTIQ